MRLLRAVVAAAGAALALCTTDAHATGIHETEVNAAATTMTATNPLIYIVRAGGGFLTARCASITVPATITTPGVPSQVSVAANAVRFGGCTMNGLPATVFQPAAWEADSFMHLDVTYLGNTHVANMTLPFSLPSNGIRVSGALCTFDLGGTLLGSHQFPPTPPRHWVLVAVSTLAFSAALAPAGSLTVNNAAPGCVGAGIATGDTATVSATFGLSPAVVGRGHT